MSNTVSSILLSKQRPKIILTLPLLRLCARSCPSLPSYTPTTSCHTPNPTPPRSTSPTSQSNPTSPSRSLSRQQRRLTGSFTCCWSSSPRCARLSSVREDLDGVTIDCNGVFLHEDFAGFLWFCRTERS